MIFFPDFDCEEHDNPADFFLDVITSCERTRIIEGDSGFQGRSDIIFMDILGVITLSLTCIDFCTDRRKD